ncbi:unnamed protein product [Nesidiocoris tenuis]|uniref:PHD-type domain-containing protein n=1 Tax=Nesidiocoris tenuis TaxID=355587 RepID=A0A6H5HJ08_9HEMI|nr:unnamed protein product [Nesidiocoris tenuis]
MKGKEAAGHTATGVPRSVAFSELSTTMSNGDTCNTCSKTIDNQRDAALCSSCSSIHHIACVGYTPEAWSKEGQRKAQWKCATCKETIRIKTDVSALVQKQKKLEENLSLFDKKISDIREAFDIKFEELKTLQTQNMDEVRAEMNKIIQAYETVNAKLSAIEKKPSIHDPTGVNSANPAPLPGQSTLSDGSVLYMDAKIPATSYYSAIPHFLEDKLKNLPKFREHDDLSILQFLSGLYDLHMIAEKYFIQILERVATTQNIKLLQRLLADTPNQQELTFQQVAKQVLNTLTSIKTRMSFQLEFLFRPQKNGETFREYVEDLTKYSIILQAHSPSEVIEIILTGVNDQTRSKFQFQTTPTTLKELDNLIEHVEKLEKHADTSKSREDLSDLSNFAKAHFSQPKNYSYRPQGNHMAYRPVSPNPPRQNLSPQPWQPRGGYHPPRRAPNNNYTWNNQNRQNQSSNSPVPKPQRQSSFRANNPNWTTKFKKETVNFAQPLYPMALPPWSYYNYAMYPFPCPPPPTAQEQKTQKNEEKDGKSNKTNQKN